MRCRWRKVLNVRTKNAKVKPGDKVAIDVTMKPYRGEEFTKTVYFKVPKDHPGGKLALNVRGGSSMAWAIELLRKQQSEGVTRCQEKGNTPQAQRLYQEREYGRQE